MKRPLSILVIIILNALSVFSGFGQINTTRKPQLLFNNLSEGLNNERITAVSQDKLGFIWIGTYNAP